MYRIVLRLGCSRLVLRDFRDRVDLVIGQGAPGPSLPRLDVGNRPLVFRGWYLLGIGVDVVGERVAARSSRRYLWDDTYGAFLAGAGAGAGVGWRI